MTAGSGEFLPQEPDPLLSSSAGTALAGVASLLWPELISAALSLAVLASFVVWVRAVRVLRRPQANHYAPNRLLPLLLLGAAGWSATLLVPPVLAEGRALILGALGVGLWVLARPAFAGV
ncbi:MAG: hypothetical protein L3K14_02010 [Thermoplasmata archaeon]|nr:hypothetical protein [Thermoplasmata archaeon]